MKKISTLAIISLLLFSTFSILAPQVKAETSTGLYAGGTNPGVVYEYKGDTTWAAISSSLGWSVTSLTTYEGKLFAAVITDPYIYSSVGKVYRYDGVLDWTLVGTLDNQVTFLIVYKGELYAGTATPARLYKYDPTTASWSKVLEYGPWFGFRSAYVWRDWLYLGEWYWDRFARWDGSTFQEFQPYYWGSCIYSIEEYKGALYAGAYIGRIYRVTAEPPTATAIWGPAPNYRYAWSLKSFKDYLYIGFDANGTGVAPLYKYDGIGFTQVWSYSTTTTNYHEGIISMATDGTYLYIGVGGQAIGYPTYMSGVGTGKIYRTLDGTTFEPISGTIGTGIQVLYVPVTVKPATVIFGEVTDGHGHSLSDVEVKLLGDLTPLLTEAVFMTTKTNEEGRYLFTDVTPSGTPMLGGYVGRYRVMVNLTSFSESLSSPIFEVFHDAGPVVYAKTPYFTILEGERKEINIDFADSSLETDPTIPQQRLPDMAAIYFHVKQVVDFVTNVLRATLDLDLPIEIHAYSTLTRGAYYSGGEVYIGAAISDYTDRNRPMNREWHETFHELMDDTVGIPPYHEGDVNHGGYPNHCTVDSWVEGWAEFWPTALRRQLGEPNPQLYVWEGGHTSFERNWRVWDTLGWWLWRRSVEEFAVASLLWDVIDPVNSADNDFISLSIEQLWSIIGSIRLNDMRDVYERFVSQNIGGGDSDNDGISDLDELFIAHGFFADANGNRRYDTGEEVGWGGRVGRRNTPPIPGAYLLVSIVNGEGNFLRGILMVEVHFEPPNDIYDYSYEVELEAGNNLIGFAVAPAEEEAIIKMQVKDEAGNLSDTFIMTNSMYWQNVEGSTLGYAVEHTFQSGASDKTTVLANYDFDPNVLNLRSVGNWATLYIELPEEYNVREIDIATISITEINDRRLTEPLKAVADPKYGFVKDPEFYDMDNDGVSELMVKFDRRKLLALLSVGQYTLTIIGKLKDGIEFKGPALINVIDS